MSKERMTATHYLATPARRNIARNQALHIVYSWPIQCLELSVAACILRTANRGMHQTFNLSRVVGLCAGALMLSGCNTPPYDATRAPTDPLVVPSVTHAPVALRLPSQASDYQQSVGGEIVIRAISLLGSPYQWGGSGPKAFDCSGLVHFIHNELGISVPRTAEDQFRAARRVDVDALEPGDLLFFKIRGKRISHVAIYAGSGRFVHAPQTGRPVEIRTLSDSYYRPRLAGAGRLF